MNEENKHIAEPKPIAPVARQPGKEKITITKLTPWQLIAAAFAVLFVVSILTGGFGIIGEDAQTVPTPAPSPSPTPQPQPAPEPPRVVDVEELLDDDPFKGDADAPVTIIEWSDFECPFCARFFTETLPQIQSEYIDTGKVKLVYRDFPLGFHAQAQKAAEAAECAGEQDMYFEMHDKLFEEGVAGGVTAFKQYAADLGLDQEAFDDCLDSGAMAAEIAKDMQDGQAAGITGTPGFIINGQLVSGAQPFSNFKTIIDAELA